MDKLEKDKLFSFFEFSFFLFFTYFSLDKIFYHLPIYPWEPKKDDSRGADETKLLEGDGTLSGGINTK